MGAEPQSGAVSHRQKRGFMPPEVVELLVPPIKVGTWAGVAGSLAGVAGAIARDTSPVASGIFSGVQWFTLGSSYWFARIVAIRALGGEEQVRPADRTIASAIAGSAAGAVSGLTRGPSRILPAMAIWGLIGAGGQVAVNQAGTRERQISADKESWLAKLTPLRKLSDAEYADMLSEKILKVDVDIALIDDRIADLRAGDKANGSSGQRPQ